MLYAEDFTIKAKLVNTRTYLAPLNWNPLGHLYLDPLIPAGEFLQMTNREQSPTTGNVPEREEGK